METTMVIEKIDYNLCITCRTCVETCPMDVLRMDKKTNRPIIRYPEDCMICKLCLIYCPKDAITISPFKHTPIMVGWG